MIVHSNDSCFKLIGDQLVAKRKGEKFKRIKCSTLAKLLQENVAEESVYNLANMDPHMGHVRNILF